MRARGGVRGGVWRGVGGRNEGSNLLSVSDIKQRKTILFSTLDIFHYL